RTAGEAGRDVRVFRAFPVREDAGAARGGTIATAGSDRGRGEQMIGGGVYDTRDAAEAAAEKTLRGILVATADCGKTTRRRCISASFGVYRANTNPNVWVWESPPRG